jgi:GNAT superfamily N-acetyltransferase
MPAVRLLTTAQEAEAAASQFLASLEGWEPRDALAVTRGTADPWDEKLGDTWAIAGVYRAQCAAMQANFACFFDGEAKGLLSVSAASSELRGLQVSAFVTHPGAAGAGGALLERAATYSQSQGHGGRLWLTAQSEAAAEAYRRLGFTGTPQHMSFDPSAAHNAARWIQRDGQWFLRKYETKPLARGMSDVGSRLGDIDRNS